MRLAVGRAALVLLAAVVAGCGTPGPGGHPESFDVIDAEADRDAEQLEIEREEERGESFEPLPPVVPSDLLDATTDIPVDWQGEWAEDGQERYDSEFDRLESDAEATQEFLDHLAILSETERQALLDEISAGGVDLSGIVPGG